MLLRPTLPSFRVPTLAASAFVTLLVLGRLGALAASPPVDFDRVIRPILSNNCFQCHGPDESQRKSRLRLDDVKSALQPAESGAAAVVPGKPDDSELVRRIFSDKPDEVMPPPDSGKSLKPEQKDALKAWVAAGAPARTHWSYAAPHRPDLPTVKDESWPMNEIDRFVLAKLESQGLHPSSPADKATLIRRVTLDLLGLPPSPADVDAFVADSRENAYELLVDKLLANPHFGERMAMDWLDAARYADTHGYHIDSGRDMTLWRDWVIQSFNRNLAFDEFTVWQLAGDLLPNATTEQKIASGFNRNHMINFEGGAIPDEYHNAYIINRVNTTTTVWLGMTVACAQCHEHKYDPITQREYYQLYAFFYNVPENGLDGSKGNAAPVLKVPSDEQTRQLAQLDGEIRNLEQQFAGSLPEVDAEQAEWEASAAAGKAPADQTPAPIKAILDTPSDKRTDAQRQELRQHFRQTVSSKAAELRKRLEEQRRCRNELDNKIPTTMVMQEMPQPREAFLLVRGAYDKKGEKVVADVPAFLPRLPEGVAHDRLALARWFVAPEHPLTSRVIVNRIWQSLFGIGIVRTAEDFGSQGELPSHPELLDWMATQFQSPGRSPGSDESHAWNVKALVKLMVMSATYRQSSGVVGELWAKDPDNRLLARGPRFRLPAEMIRDMALSVSGLLNDSIGGHSVSPYQPPGIWEELASREDGKNWTAQEYVQSHGADLYRRTMYTFWKRSAPPPSLVTFDAPDRETCVVRRARTNTPLQALVLLNDPTYVEASRKLAERMLREAGNSPEERIALAFRLALSRKPSQRETASLLKTVERVTASYRANPAAVEELLKVGETPRDSKLDGTELAAWTIAASVILNLDETLTKG